MTGRPQTSRAIDEAKGFFVLERDDPKVPTDCVLLREACHALEIRWRYSDEELAWGCDPRAPQALLDALRSGQLRARAYGTSVHPASCTIIPAGSWPIINQEAGEDAFKNGFWMHGVVRYEQDCAGFVGAVPFILRDEAERWIDEQAKEARGSPKGGAPRIAGIEEAYRKLYPNGHRSAGDSMKGVALRVSDEVGRHVSPDTILRRLGQKK